ncbi:MAG: PQQ-like beta-propeller repeat protein [Verrucomicrobiae bacterium]|nr:PQQ-like beta-propeller repeat protein [Verrucomicrobiae bacterium]
MQFYLASFCRLGAAVAFIILPSLEGGDWPQWRGPGRDGKSSETGLLASWPASGPRLVWKAEGLGAGYATVAVSNGRVFTAGETKDDSYILAFSEADGQLLWKSQLGKAGAPGWGGFAGPRCTPTVDGDRLYSLGQYGELVCLESATGKELWRRNLVKDFGGSVPEWGYSESPLVDGERVICTPGGKKGAVVALDRKTGQVVWRSEGFTDEAQYASLVPMVLEGKRFCVQLTMESVVGISLDDGTVLWRAARRGAVAVVPTPVVSGNHVYVTSGYNIGCNLFRLSFSGGRFGVEEVYKNKTMANHHGGVILVGDHVYGHSDTRGWVCQELLTGKEVWSERSKVGKGSILYADGHLYLREEDKGKSQVVLVEATPSGYREKGRFEQPFHSGKEAWPHPVIANGKLYLRDQDILLCYDVKAQ